MSTITQDDYILLKSTLNVLDNQDYQCEKCLVKYKRHNDYKNMTVKLRRLRGCEVKSDRANISMDDLSYRRCPGNYYSRSCVSLIETYQYFDKGILPYEGPLSDQPNKVIEAYKIIGNHYATKQAAEMDKIKAKDGRSKRNS